MLGGSQRLCARLGVGLPALVVSQHWCSKSKGTSANGSFVACEAPKVFAVRHAESVANVAKKQDPQKYTFECWQDDSSKEPHERLRDAILSPDGIEATVTAAEDMQKENQDGGHIMLVVSPMTRTMLTASLLFHRLQESGHPMTVVVEPACREVIVAPHDIVENLGRAPNVAVAEAEQVLKKHEAPDAALALLGRIGEAAKHLEPEWWFEATAANRLPVRVLCSQMSQRQESIRNSLKAHLAASELCVRVYIICHWGVLYTLSGDRGAKNLEIKRIDGFLESHP